MKIRAVGASTTLLKVVKNPVTQYLPTGCRKIGTYTRNMNVSPPHSLLQLSSTWLVFSLAGTSVKGELVNAIDFVPTLPKQPVAFVFGSHASGPVIVDYTEEDIALSQYPVRVSIVCNTRARISSDSLLLPLPHLQLSAATALARLVHAFEHMWNIL